MRKIVITTIVLCFLTGVWLLMSSGEPSQVNVSPRNAEIIAAEGRVGVKPDRRALLSAEVAGRVEQVLVDNLQQVKKGQLLAVQYNADLANRLQQTDEAYRMAQARYQELASGYRTEEIQEAAAQVQKAESDLELAERNEARDHELMLQEVIAESRYDTTIAERKKAEAELNASRERYKKLMQGERKETVEAARAEMMSQKYALESLKATYEKTFLRSPLDGIVIRRYLNASEFADIAKPVVEVADLSEKIVEGEINEMDAGRIREGLKAIVTSDAYPGRQFQAEVYEVSQALKPRNSDPENPAVIVDQKILPVKVKFLEPPPLKLGMRVDLKILL
jgi:multidrug resistance efflux pump